MFVNFHNEIMSFISNGNQKTKIILHLKKKKTVKNIKNSAQMNGLEVTLWAKMTRSFADSH